MTLDDRESLACPWLGTPSDRESYFRYPSSENYCFSPSPSKPVRLDHQATYCLGKWRECPVYQNAEISPALIFTTPPHHRKKPFTRRPLFALMILLGVIGGVLWLRTSLLTEKLPFSVPPFNSPETEQVAPTFFATSLATPSPQEIFTPSFTPPFIPSPSPSPTFSPTPALKHILDEHIGPSLEFIIHQVLPGESLELLARQYNTTPEAIQQINYRGLSPAGVVWAGSVIIIPVNLSSVQGYPKLEAVQISTPSSAREFAEALGVSLRLFLEYNWLQENETLQLGWWLLVPRE